nr:xylulose kinase-1 [Tanacetum cinerariifolium]
MTFTSAETHNMIAYLSKSDISEGFNQIINFLNGSSIKYALTVNPNIYVSCIKQFWTSVAVKKVNDIMRLQALVDNKKVVISEATIRDALRLDDVEGIECLSNEEIFAELAWTSVAVKKVNDIMRLQALVDNKKVVISEATIRDALRLDDVEGIECLPNEEIFAELARIGYEKPSTKLTFYKAFFSSQWKFLIHTILQCMSAKRTSWNEFSSSMASAVICLSTGKGLSGVKTPLFRGMIVEQQVDEGANEVHDESVPAAGVVAEGDVSAADDVVLTAIEEPYIPSFTPPTPPP